MATGEMADPRRSVPLTPHITARRSTGTPLQGTQRFGVGVADPAGDCVRREIGGVPEVLGSFQAQALNDVERGQAEDTSCAPLEGSAARADGRSCQRDVERLVEVPANVSLEREHDRVVVVEVIESDERRLGGPFVDEQEAGNVLSELDAHGP